MKRAHVTIGTTTVGLDLTRRSSPEWSDWSYGNASVQQMLCFPRDPVSREIRDEIIRMAVEKIYGRRCWWLPDSGLGWRYGQVFRSLRSTMRDSNPGNSSVTSRVGIEIEIDGEEI